MTPKQQIEALLAQLPEDASFREIQDHLNSYGGYRPEAAARPAQDESQSASAFRRWQEMVSI